MYMMNGTINEIRTVKNGKIILYNNIDTTAG
jgi:hypothetical protein